MENTIESRFNELIDERIHQIAYRKCINDSEYLAANTDVIATTEMLRSTLATDKQRSLLNELESALLLAEAIFLEYSYRQGIEDSQMVRKGVELFCNRNIMFVK